MKHLLNAYLACETLALGLEALPTPTLLAAAFALVLGHESLAYCLRRGGLN